MVYFALLPFCVYYITEASNVIFQYINQIYIPNDAIWKKNMSYSNGETSSNLYSVSKGPFDFES
jgi:hypothetical protein